ncbi:hypothetical protein EfmAA242_02940 [Enterococcus faecium]|nr:hypothetical protein EfmAA242_02940 [Enterococcus faecium]
MMSKNNTNGRNQFAMLTIDDLVPQDHLVRKIDAALDFEFIYPIVEATYSDLGRPSIDPVILIKLVFIQYLFGIRSMRQTILKNESFHRKESIFILVLQVFFSFYWLAF